jgi:transcriptional regulator with XRE-family HTH domain
MVTQSRIFVYQCPVTPGNTIKPLIIRIKNAPLRRRGILFFAGEIIIGRMYAQTENVTLDIQATIATAHRIRPAIFEVVKLLGLRTNTVAECLGVSQTVISLWASGRYGLVPRPRQRQLFALCHEAHTKALRVIAEAAARSINTPLETAAINAYSDRVAKAGKLLSKVETIGAV